MRTSTTEHIREAERDASVILSRVVNDSLFFNYQEVQDLPTLKQSEIEIGPILGNGEFNTVYEIRRIELIPSPDATSENDPEKIKGKRNELVRLDNNDRTYMSERCLRAGVARYAIKKNTPQKSDIDFDAFIDDDLVPEPMKPNKDAMIDLAIESKFLSAVSHPNIIKMRATGGVPGQIDFFLVLDRLHGTLSDKIKYWRKEKRKNKGFLGMNESKDKMTELHKIRLNAAYDIARALRYLHEHKILYRDLKPENIGFDVRGTVKLFDFGLAKELIPGMEKQSDDLYNLTGHTGSMVYMAPEVHLFKPYNLSADVYSFGILLWEIWALKMPFGNISAKNYAREVVQKGKRPIIKPSVLVNVANLMKMCWSPVIRERPSMDRVCNVLNSELTLSNGSHSIDRSTELFDMSLDSRMG